MFIRPKSCNIKWSKTNEHLLYILCRERFVVYLTTLQCLRLGRLGGRVVRVLATGQRVAVSNRFHGMLKNSCSTTMMDRLNSYFLRPSPIRARDVSGDAQSALVDKLGVSPSRSRLLTGSHLSLGDSTTGPRPQCWDVSLNPSQPNLQIYNLRLWTAAPNGPIVQPL
jgi:hypothetical protein